MGAVIRGGLSKINPHVGLNSLCRRFVLFIKNSMNPGHESGPNPGSAPGNEEPAEHRGSGALRIDKGAVIFPIDPSMTRGQAKGKGIACLPERSYG